MAYLYAGLGMVMLTGIMAIFQMAVAMVGQQNAEPVRADATAQNYLPLEKIILTGLAAKRGNLKDCDAVKAEVAALTTANQQLSSLRTIGCKGSLLIYSSPNGEYRLALQWIDQSTDPELWSCARSATALAARDKACELSVFS